MVKNKYTHMSNEELLDMIMSKKNVKHYHNKIIENFKKSKQREHTTLKYIQKLVIENDLCNLTKKEASEIIQRNIVQNKPLLQWYVWKDKKTNIKYACTIHSDKQYKKGNDDCIIYAKVFLKKRQAEEYHKQRLIMKSPNFI